MTLPTGLTVDVIGGNGPIVAQIDDGRAAVGARSPTLAYGGVVPAAEVWPLLAVESVLRMTTAEARDVITTTTAKHTASNSVNSNQPSNLCKYNHVLSPSRMKLASCD